jgi:hypothetical protein
MMTREYIQRALGAKAEPEFILAFCPGLCGAVSVRPWSSIAPAEIDKPQNDPRNIQDKYLNYLYSRKTTNGYDKYQFIYIQL